MNITVSEKVQTELLEATDELEASQMAGYMIWRAQGESHEDALKFALAFTVVDRGSPDDDEVVQIDKDMLVHAAAYPTTVANVFAAMEWFREDFGPQMTIKRNTALINLYLDYRSEHGHEYSCGMIRRYLASNN